MIFFVSLLQASKVFVAIKNRLRLHNKRSVSPTAHKTRCVPYIDFYGLQTPKISFCILFFKIEGLS